MGAGLSKNAFPKQYELQELLGKGTFASVYRAVRKADGLPVAVKIVKKRKLKPDELRLLAGEVGIMQRLDHPNCVRLFCVAETRGRLHIVMELLTGGDLFDRIVRSRQFNEQQAARVVRDVASGLAYLHQMGICHRDIKPENLMYSSPEPDSPLKITDYGLAAYTSRELTTPCGTPGYVAPEVIKLEPYGCPADLWSLGVILYVLLCGFPPFYHENVYQLYGQIKRADYGFPSPFWDGVSHSAKHLVQRLLTLNPARRYTAEQVLQHPWVAQLNKISPKPFAGDYNSRIALLRARARFRKAVHTVIAFNRFSRHLQGAAAAENSQASEGSGDSAERSEDRSDYSDDDSGASDAEEHRAAFAAASAAFVATVTSAAVSASGSASGSAPGSASGSAPVSHASPGYPVSPGSPLDSHVLQHSAAASAAGVSAAGGAGGARFLPQPPSAPRPQKPQNYDLHKHVVLPGKHGYAHGYDSAGVGGVSAGVGAASGAAFGSASGAGVGVGGNVWRGPGVPAAVPVSPPGSQALPEPFVGPPAHVLGPAGEAKEEQRQA